MFASKFNSNWLNFHTKSHAKINLAKAGPLGLLLADMPKDFQLSIKIALFKIFIQRLKLKCLTFRHFYTQYFAQIDLTKAWPLAMLLAKMPRRFSITYLNSPGKCLLQSLIVTCLIFMTFSHPIPR